MMNIIKIKCLKLYSAQQRTEDHQNVMIHNVHEQIKYELNLYQHKNTHHVA